MKIWRIMTGSLLCLVLAGVTGCTSLDEGELSTEQRVEVIRGDLAITVSGSGNIEIDNEMDLTFGTAGRVEEIYFEKGDEVKKRDVIARLETDDLELAVSQAQVAVTQAQVNVTQAQASLQTAEYNLEETADLYTLADIKVAESDVDEAERYVDEVVETLKKYDPGSPGEEFWQKALIHAQSRLNTAEDTLDAMLAGTDTQAVAIKRLQLEASQQSVALAEQSLVLAEQSLDNAEVQLARATITAPFAGVIADVYVDENDTVSTATPIVSLIDPSSMQLKVEVDEIDIPDVSPEQSAIIEVDALPDWLFEGKVSYINLLPTEQTGVIVYDVDILFDVPDDANIRAGMSATADIILDQRSDVLLVPDRAVQQNTEGNYIAEVVVDDEIEVREITIGISNDFYTEVVDGLEEGDIVIERRTVSTSSTSLF